MLLTFKTLQGQTFTLEVDPTITVRFCLDFVDLHRFFFRNKQMSNLIK
jgi:hypothetical protein